MKSMTLRLVSVLALCPALARAQAILQVPAQYPTIQAAIQAAQGSDVVMVSPGTYFENLDLLGKSITVRGLQGAQATVVDGMGLNVTLWITGGQPRVEGLTIRNGASPLSGGERRGGGVRISGGNPSLADCVITQNVLNGATTLGAGVYSSGAFPILERCQITDNRCNGTTFGEGAGAYVRQTSALTIRACVFQGNIAQAFGGGLYLQGSFNPAPGSILVESTVFAGNQLVSFISNGYGGGLYYSGGHGPIIRACTFDSNSSSFGAGAYLNVSPTGEMMLVESCRFTSNVGLLSGGLHVYSYTAAPAGTIRSCEFRGNRTTFVGNPAGAAIYLQAGGIVVDSCLLASNVLPPGSAGGALVIGGTGGNPGPPEIRNCTIAGNTGGRIVHSVHPIPPMLANCIVALNTPDPPGTPIGGNAQFHHSLIPGVPGIGNSSADPMFVNAAAGDFHLLPGSPAIDAGAPTAGSSDIDGDPRTLGAAIDIGADEHHASMQLLLDQPQGSGSARIRLQGGTAGYGAFTTLSFYPQEPGWGVDTRWWGLWTIFSDVYAQFLAGGPPFLMPLDAAGSATWQVGAGTLPLAGITVHGVTVTWNPSPFAWGAASSVVSATLF